MLAEQVLTNLFSVLSSVLASRRPPSLGPEEGLAGLLVDISDAPSMLVLGPVPSVLLLKQLDHAGVVGLSTHLHDRGLV